MVLFGADAFLTVLIRGGFFVVEFFGSLYCQGVDGPSPRYNNELGLGCARRSARIGQFGRWHGQSDGGHEGGDGQDGGEEDAHDNDELNDAYR